MEHGVAPSGQVFEPGENRLGFGVFTIDREPVSDAEMVNALGINVPLVFLFVFGVGKAAVGAYGMHVIGFRDGFRGLMENRTMELEAVLSSMGEGVIAIDLNEEIRRPIRRRSVSSCVSPGPRVPMPPPVRDRCVHKRVRRGNWYSNCANSTWMRPSCVRAL